MKSKPIKRNDPDGKMIACVNCGKVTYHSAYAQLCHFIMKQKPVCSYECNKALGQVK